MGLPPGRENHDSGSLVGNRRGQLFSYRAYQLGVNLGRSLPFASACRLAEGLAAVQYLVAPRYRNQLLFNLGQATDLPVRKRRRIAWRAFRGFSSCVTDFLRLSPERAPELQSRFEVSGYRILENLRNSGRGVIIVSAHLGCWELGAAYLASRGHRVCGIALEHADPRVDRFFVRAREAMGVEVVPLSGGSFAPLEKLRSGRILGMLVDRAVGEARIRAGFFGRAAMMPRAHASLAVRTGAVMVPAFSLQCGGGRYRLVIEEPVEVPGAGSLNERLSRAVRACLEVIERYIKDFPEQWYAFHPIWDS